MRIPEAMAWKYNAKCAKTPKGDDIAVWQHPIMPQPSKTQVAIDVQEYLTWKAIDDAEKVQVKQDMENEIVKPAGNPFKILKALRRLGRI